MEKILERLDLTDIPLIRVFNKIDLVPDDIVQNVCTSYSGIAISALDSKTFPPLIHRLEDEVVKTLSQETETLQTDDNDAKSGTRLTHGSK